MSERARVLFNLSWGLDGPEFPTDKISLLRPLLLLTKNTCGGRISMFQN